MAVRKLKPVEANDGSYAGMVLAEFDRQAAGAVAVAKTIVFTDYGQDFLEWDIDSSGRVIGCRPFQSAVWLDSVVLNPNVKVGEQVHFKSDHVEHPLTIRYPVEAVR